MKRIGILFLTVALLLAGCAGETGDPSWEEGWTPMGDHFAIEPLEGFTLNESNDVLSISGLYYATWTSGEGRDFVNSEGKDATVYDGQIYVLLKECGSGEDAAREVEDWIAREQQSYETAAPEALTVGSQEYQLLPLANGKESNPYSFGIAAFAVRRNVAISVELVCSERFTGEPRVVMERFLAGFHYAGEQEG